MTERNSSSSPDAGDPRTVDRDFEARVVRSGESLPRWGRYVTVFEETVGLAPSRRIRLGITIVDVFNAGVERINRRFAGYLYRALIHEVDDPAGAELLKIAEEQHAIRRIRQTVARVLDHPDLEGDSTLTRHQ